MKVCVVIPSYNGADAIGRITKRLRQQGLEVVVVDDGSQDNTSSVARDNGAIVMRNALNAGKGASLMKGFDYAVRNNFDAVIAMDGDGQHLPEEAVNFIQAAETEPYALLIGNRMAFTKGMPAIRRLTNQLLSWLISKIIGQYIPDSQCGFRLIKIEALKNIQLKSSRFEIDSEIIIKMWRAGYKIKSVPIKTVYRSEMSQINPALDSIRFIKFIYGVLTGKI
jgi:glycosyltransferase involved in cell wall biosynthesis